MDRFNNRNSTYSNFSIYIFKFFHQAFIKCCSENEIVKVTRKKIGTISPSST